MTPMMRQYQEIKEQYSDCLLFFRLGDFYEMFAEDAKIASRELEIILTARDGGNGSKIPMCGVPFHAVDNYLARLISRGHKVAICEQVEDPKAAKGIVRREVVRVVTPGTVLDSNMLNEEKHNYLLAVWREKDGFGLAYSDISTGDFWTCEIGGEDYWDKLSDEICRIAPAECILPANLYHEEIFQLRLAGQAIGTLSRFSDEDFIKSNAESLLCIHFNILSLDSLGLGELPLAAKAAAMLLYFVQQTQKNQAAGPKKLQVYHTGQFMFLDSVTRRNLEISATIRSNQRKGSLLWVCDQTKTAMGARLLREWLEKPLLDSILINRRLEAVGELHKDIYLSEELAADLKKVYDLERLINRTVYGTAGSRELLALANSLRIFPDILQKLEKLTNSFCRQMIDYFDIMDDITKLLEQALACDPPASLREGGLIKDGYNEEADNLRQLAKSGKSKIAGMEQAEKERSGIKSLKIGFNKVFGYYIEVTRANLEHVPADYIRKQTLANAERYITEELKEWEDKVLNASERLAALEYSLFVKIREEVARNAGRIQDCARVIANLDVLQSLAKTARENDYCRPVVNDQALLRIEAGRHPVVEKIIGRENYIDNDTFFDKNSQQMMLITGPNMTGKSTYMRQVALIVLLGRIGSFVPAQSATIGKIDRIFTRVGASDDLGGGQSTFMVEMCETANILRHAGGDSLIILDEIGRGTSTFDGISIAWAVAEYIMRASCRAKTLFATHYHELTALADHFPLIKNYSIAVREKAGDIIFLRKIIPGAADKSYGIQVASLAGLPKTVVGRAKEILRQLESENHNQINLAPSSQQLSLNFSQAEPDPKPELHPLLEVIMEMNLSDMTPIEALVRLNQMQEELKSTK
ncbi:MAG: DNA mismatch repair protein MutS [Clostridiales bacterium]|nr:DNA mismatch repair protein MutS [Clostridiales bacterium]